MPNCYYNGSLIGKKVHIYGRPLHKSRTELIKLYLMDAHTYMEYESEHSCGSYFLVDNRKNIAIITSSGFTGAYIVVDNDNIHIAKTLNHVIHINPVIINMENMSRYLTDHYTHMFPMTSIFEGVQVVPPFIYININGGKLDAPKCYYVKRKSPVFREIVESYNNIFNNIQQKKDILFSGGVDSLGLSLGICGEENNITVDYGINHHNSPKRALMISKVFGMETRVVTYNGIDTSDIIEQFKTDIVNIYSPFNFLSNSVSENCLVISGQNFDAMFGINMISLPIPFWLHFAWYGNIIKIAKYLFYNFLFTDNYIKSRVIRLYVGKILNAVFKYHKIGETYYNDYSERGIYLGLLSTGIPNIVLIKSKNNINSLNDEIDKILNIIGSDLPIQKKVTLFYYYYYCFNSVRISNAFSAKRIEGVTFPATYSPFVNYALNRKRSVRTLFSPKKPLYQYVYSKTGINYRRSYNKKIYSSEYFASNKEDSDFNYPLEIIKEYGHLLKASKSKLVNIFNENNMDNSWIPEILALLKTEHYSVLSQNELVKIIKLLNVEILLRENVHDKNPYC